jgi:hypothetical protein
MPERGPRANPRGVGDAFHEDLERHLLERHTELYGARAARPARRWLTSPRVVWVTVGLALVVASMSAVPAHLKLQMARVVTVELAAGTRPPDTQALLHLVSARHGVEQASVSVDSGSSERATVLMLLFGDGIDLDGLQSEVQGALPSMASGSWKIQSLEADLRTSLARKLGHRLFAIEVNRRQLEQKRRTVLEHLASHGLEGKMSLMEMDGIRLVEVDRKEGW